MPNTQVWNTFTECVQPADYSGKYLGTLGFWAALVGSIGMAVLGYFFNPGLMPLGFLAMGIAYCEWWLYGRLICLGGNRCCIGLVLDVDTQADQTDVMGKLDTDVSFNLLLAPDPFVGNNDPNWLADETNQNPVQGALINTSIPSVNGYNFPLAGEPVATSTVVSHDGISVISQQQANMLNMPNPDGWQAGVNYNVGDKVLDGNNNIQTCTSNPGTVSGPAAPNWATGVGDETADGPGLMLEWTCNGPLPLLPSLEVEFEGAGVWDVYQALKVAVPIAMVATAFGIISDLAPIAAVFCAIPYIGWIICAIIAIAWVVSAVLAAASAGAAAGGLAAGWSDDSADMDVNANLGVIHPGSDVVFVLGRWVYDSAHSGWNELHPVLFCQKINSVSNSDLVAGTPWASIPSLQAANIQTTLQQHCGLATTAIATATITAQAQPENGWVLHPLVDGCTPPPPRLA